VSKDKTKASPQSKVVALEALDLFLKGKAKNILLAGGYLGKPDEITEAEAMARVIENSVPKEKLFLESKSYRTYMNADCTLPIMESHGWKTAIIVAQQWHARRVRATFKKRWRGSDIKFAIIKARSPYGGGSQSRLNYFWTFAIWDSLAFVFSKLKSYC